MGTEGFETLQVFHTICISSGTGKESSGSTATTFFMGIDENLSVHCDCSCYNKLRIATNFKREVPTVKQAVTA